jgi:hypothetical protein
MLAWTMLDLIMLFIPLTASIARLLAGCGKTVFFYSQALDL